MGGHSPESICQNVRVDNYRHLFILFVVRVALFASPCGQMGNVMGHAFKLFTLVGSLVLLPLVATAATPPAATADPRRPTAMITDSVPVVPDDLVKATRPFIENREAYFEGWTVDHAMIIGTRFGNTEELHKVAGPMMDRQQITFEQEPVSSTVSPDARTVVVTKDTGGDEFYQLYTLENGQLTLLTDGKSQNTYSAWSADSKWLGYSSTRRDGADSDLYVVNPHDPKSDHMVAQVSGGGWTIAAFTRDDSHAIVVNGISVTNLDLYDLDLATGKMTPIGDPTKDIGYGEVEIAPNGKVWVISDEGSDFARLGTIDVATGVFTPRSPDAKWDIAGFDISDDGSFIAYHVNEAGVGRLKVLDLKTGKSRTVTALPAGSVTGMDVAPWGEIGLTLDSARSPSDSYSVNPKTLAAVRWTRSETGGLDANLNAEPELVTVKSFDGEMISGFLYRPDSKLFPGKRPLVIHIHGGPENQSTPGFMGRQNYLINKLGIAIFFPNVRGSSGYGKRFVSLDNGPFKREDSVKDIGAFLDHFDQDAALDAERVAVTGGSYGGYMCYATAIRYGDRLKGAFCEVAISNFVTFLENTQSYRRDLRRAEYGDERDPVQRAKMIEISPVTHADQFKIPLLVASGANDPRVPPSEAAQMIEAVRANGGTAWSLLATDEGHGYQKKENRDYEFWINLMFWQQTILK